VLSREETVELARYAVAIEKHYTERAGERRPMDIEWAKDGKTGQLFIVQARPETAHAQRDLAKIVSYELRERGPVRVRGRAVGTQIGAGPVARLDNSSQLREFTPGSVLVTGMTDPDWEPIMKHAAAIVTDRGGRTCHAAIVSRELGIPCVVGAGDATTVLASGDPVTVSCAEGETGLVMEGILPFERVEFDLK
jgi:pyruvate,water dikinase